MTKEHVVVLLVLGIIFTSENEEVDPPPEKEEENYDWGEEFIDGSLGRFIKKQIDEEEQ